MANTYSQVNIHAVFSVKGRQNLLTDDFSEDLFKYISGILNNLKQFPIAVNGYRDHVHILFELQPASSISDIMRVVKANSSKWINENNFLKRRFSWQNGFGAFSYSRSQRNRVFNYINNQKIHHQSKSFRVEYMTLLDSYEIDYNGNYVFEFYD